jgi:single-strand DNA-binding protein
MNKLIINGNLVKEIDLQFSPGTGTAVLKNTVASRRKFKNKNTDQYESDFVPFTAFGKSSEFIANNFLKGQGIQIEARMQSGSYEKDGVKHYTLEAVVENVEFFGSKKENSNIQSIPADAFGGSSIENRFGDELQIDDSDPNMPF